MAVLLKAGDQVPVKPLLDVVGKDIEAPAHMEAVLPKEKLGSIFGFTVTVNVVPATHPPEVGVNTYEPDRVGSTTVGVHVPVIPLVSVLGNRGTVPFSQMVRDVPNGKPAVFIGITVMSSVTGIPQVPAAGVKV